MIEYPKAVKHLSSRVTEIVISDKWRHAFGSSIVEVRPGTRTYLETILTCSLLRLFSNSKCPNVLSGEVLHRVSH